MAALLWGTTGVVLQFVRSGSGLGPLAAAFYRLLVSAAVLCLVAGPGLIRWRQVASARAWFLLAGGLGLAAYQALYFLAVSWAGVSVATVVSLGVAPVVTLASESLSSRRFPAPRRLSALVLAIGGLALLGFGERGSTGGPHPVLGLVAAVGSGVTYGLTTIVNRHVAHSVPAAVSTVINAAVGAIALIVPAALIDGLAFRVSVGAVGGIVFMGAVTTAFAYVLFNTGLRTTATSVASILTLIEPLTATILAVTLLHERLGPLMITGGFFLLASVVSLYGEPAPATSGPISGGPSPGQHPGALTISVSDPR